MDRLTVDSDGMTMSERNLYQCPCLSQGNKIVWAALATSLEIKSYFLFCRKGF